MCVCVVVMVAGGGPAAAAARRRSTRAWMASTDVQPVASTDVQPVRSATVFPSCQGHVQLLRCRAGQVHVAVHRAGLCPLRT